MTTHDTPEAALAAALDKVEEDVGFTVYEAWPTAEQILAALDGWTLITVPSPGESAGYDREQVLEAEIARLRAALEQAHERMDVAWNVMHPGDLTKDEREAIAQALWFGMEELDALAPPDYTPTFGIIADAIEAGDEGPG